MNLPPLTLPKVPIPFEIHDMLHPMVIHFAIALPVVVFLLEIINLIVKKRAIGVVSFLLLLIASMTVGMSYLTGNVDASHIKSLSTLLQEHKTLGAYLVLLSVVVVGLKFISALWRAGVIKALYLMLLILLVAGVCKSGFDGMQFVYHDGVNVKKVEALQKVLDTKNIQTKKLDSDYKILSKEKEELNAKIQRLNTQNDEMKKALEQFKQSQTNIDQKSVVEDKLEDTNSQVISDINVTDAIKDQNITQI